jgi:predicted AlkP superfamily phosphohydrolase/phosphomutase
LTELPKHSERVLIIGWDGATFDLIEPWIEEGLMPNLARLMEEGSSRRLRSTIPTLSPPAWTSFITGKNPGRHGTFDFFRRNPSNYELLTVRNDLSSLGTLFHWINRSGKKVGVMNVPFTYPPQPVDGFMVSGLGAATEWDFVHPEEMRLDLLKRGYRIDNPVRYEGDNDQAYVDAAMKNTQVRAETTLELMKSQSWDLFMVVFMNIDQILTFMWHHMDASHPRHDARRSPEFERIPLKLHQYLDEILGKMVSMVGHDTTVIVASDHGMGPLYKELFLNNWLEEKGYLVRKRPSASKENYNQLVRRIGFSREQIWRRIGRARTQRAKAILPERLHQLVPTEYKSLSEVVDWSQTRAYSFGNVGQIYVNLAGREPEGIVAPGREYEELIASLTRDLNDFRDPDTGLPLVDHIFRRDEIYDGPFVDQAPDINIIMQDYGTITQMRREFAADEVLFQPSLNMSGFHRRDGIFIAKGPNIIPGRQVPADIIQVTPTILHAMGLPIPDDMDGTPLQDIFEREFIAHNPINRIEADEMAATASELTPDQEEALQKRLKDLGYLG